MEQANAFLSGIIMGMSTLLFIGPVFFYLLKTTTETGVKAGFSVAIGIIVGDLLCVFTILYADFDFIHSSVFQKWFSLLGAIMLVLFAYYSLWPKASSKPPHSKSHSKLKIGIVGFTLNFINPFVFAVWLGFATIIDGKFDSRENILWSFIGILFIIFSTDLLKVLMAKSLVSFFNPGRLRRFGQITAVVILLFALRLVVHFFSF